MNCLDSGGMDDSSLFMEWAMDTLQQHDHPPAAAAAYHFGSGDAFDPSLQERRGGSMLQADQVAAHGGHRTGATNSWSSGDADSAGGGCTGNASPAVVEQRDDWSSNSVQCAPSSSVGSTNYRPVSWNFTSAAAQPSSETTAPNPCLGTTTTPSIPCDGTGAPYGSPPRASAKRAAAASTGHTSSPKPHAQDHIMAERKRREKINRRFIELSTVIPGLKKMDKATILADAVKYVKEQQEKLKALEDRTAGGGGGRTMKSAVLAKKQCIAAATDGGGCQSSPSSAGGTNGNVVLPEIEARISESESSVMVRIHCEDGKGVIVGLLAEVEGLHLTITNSSVISFPSCTLVVTVVAKVEEGYSVTSEDILARLNSVLLHRHGSRSSNAS